MAQTNVMVSYAPARRPAAPAAEIDGRSRRRWGTALTGALLAGGAVFALGTFVRPDGTVRETGVPSVPSVPLAKANRASAPEAAPPPSEMIVPEAPPSTLPYLAVVRDAAPSPPPSAAVKRPLSAPVSRHTDRAPPRVAMRAALAPVSSVDSPQAEQASLVPSPAAEPVTGQRRDLEGFLGEQGLVLATPPQANESVSPVEAWTPDEVAPAGIESPSADPLPAQPLTASLATADAVTLVPSGTDVIDAIEMPEPDPVAATATLVEVPAAAAPQPAVKAEPTRLTSIEPVESEMAATAPAEATAIASRDEPAEATRRLVVVPTAAPVSPGAGSADAPAAPYAQSFPLAVVNGEPLGAVTLRDLGTQGQAVHLGALVGLLKLRMPEAEFAWLSSAAAADQFVTLDRLRAAGITIQLDARDGRLLIDAH